MSTSEDRLLPLEIKERRAIWRKRKNVWLTLYYALGIVGLLASILAASLPEPFNKVCAVISAMCFGGIGFLKPQTRSFAYVRAWRVLDIACLRYMKGIYELPRLFDEVERAEKLIGDQIEGDPDIIPGNTTKG
jgi:hypothetical protein